MKVALATGHFHRKLLSIMLILVTAEMRSLAQLHGDQKLLERQQIKRLNQAATNTPSITMAEFK